MAWGCVVWGGVSRPFRRETKGWDREESQNGEKIYSCNLLLAKQAFRSSMYQAHLAGSSGTKSRPPITTA